MSKRQQDSRLIYPEVQAPDADHFDQMREHPQIYEEVPISDRTMTANSFDSESGMYAAQPQDSGRSDSEVVQSSEDLCAESVASKKANLQKWQRKHRRCSIALLVLAVVFMTCAGFHLLFPPRFDKMMKHGGRGPHERQAPPMDHEGPRGHRFEGDEHMGFDERRDGRRGGRHLRRDGKGDRFDEFDHPPRHHDGEFFDVKRMNFDDDVRDNDWFPKMKFNDDKRPPRPGHDGKQNGEYHVDKKVLQERRVSKLMTRASFVSFLMWLFIAIAATIGLRAAK